jgi:arylsulfatase A-like enzyme
MLKAAGVEVPAALPGLDLRDHPAMTKRASIEVESYTHDIMEMDAPEKSLTARVIIDGWSKLIVPGPVKMEGPKAKFASIAGVDELYDLKSDPTETRNLAAEKPDEVKRLKGMLSPLGKK